MKDECKEPQTPSSPNDAQLQKLMNRLELQIAMKAGVAASISLYLGVAFAKWLGRPDTLISGTWCVLSTFVVMQAHLGGTYRAAWIRFLGVLIGSFTGGLFTSLFGSNAITLGISVVLTVLSCSLLQIKDSIRIACMSVSIVMILWGMQPSISPWQFGWYRFLDSTLGILIAVIISHTLWPTKATQKLRLSVAKTVQMINRLFQMELSLKPPSGNFQTIHKRLTREIEQSIAQAQDFLVDSELEVLSRTRRIEEWSSLLDRLSIIFDATKELNTFHTCSLERILDEHLRSKLEETMNKAVKSMNLLIQRLKREYAEEPSQELREAVEELNKELARFRTTKATRKFERNEVEKFFVFFYNLRLVIEELIKMEEKVYSLLA
ncbi:putative membrane protein [Waddlia chondrophila 2032/99]|uniref:Putative membrane protein n=1 Tax=Waddlia chondrophila 2032/99 TaxID=765953 RepID=F8LFF0_9BACT|nr:putative membrane protein [Waddlia chondrophila 2032/99]